MYGSARGGEMHGRRCLVVQTLVEPFLVIKVEVPAEALFERQDTVIVFHIDILLLNGAPQALDEHIGRSRQLHP